MRAGSSTLTKCRIQVARRSASQVSHPFLMIFDPDKTPDDRRQAEQPRKLPPLNRKPYQQCTPRIRRESLTTAHCVWRLAAPRPTLHRHQLDIHARIRDRPDIHPAFAIGRTFTPHTRLAADSRRVRQRLDIRASMPYPDLSGVRQHGLRTHHTQHSRHPSQSEVLQ